MIKKKVAMGELVAAQSSLSKLLKTQTTAQTAVKLAFNFGVLDKLSIQYRLAEKITDPAEFTELSKTMVEVDVMPLKYEEFGNSSFTLYDALMIRYMIEEEEGELK